MNLRTTTDRAVIAPMLERLLTEDPVRHTILGTILGIVQDGSGDPWCAYLPGELALAVRSEPIRPVVVTKGWQDVDPLISVLVGLPFFETVSGPADVASAVAAAVARRSGRAARKQAMRLFRLDALTAPTVVGSARAVTAGDRELVFDWYVAFGREARDTAAISRETVDHDVSTSQVWLWVDAERVPVSLATRRRPVAGSARIGPVYTPPPARGHGYGSAVTAVATREILELGAIPVLFTDLANPVSNSIYQRLGYRAVDDYAMITLR